MKIEEMYGTVEEPAPARQAPATAGMPMIKKESMGKKAMPPPTVSENAVVQDVAKRASEAEAASPFPFQNVADIAAQVAGSPVAQAAAAALLGGYAYKKGSEIIGESKAKKGLSDRLFNTQGRVEPSMATGAQPSPLAPTNQFPGTPQELEKALGPNWQKAMQQSDELRRQRQAQAQIEINKQMGMPNATVGQTTENIAPVLDQSSQTPMGDIKPVEELKEDIKPTEQTQEKQKNKPGRKTKEEKAAILAKQGAIVPPPGSQQIPENWGKGMGWLTGRFGVEGAQQFIDEYNKGQPFGSYDEFQKVWKDLTGKTPGVQGQIYGPSYSDIPSDVRKSRGISPVAPQYNTNLKPGYAIPVEPGTKTPKGSANLSGLLGMLGMGGLMYMGTTPESQAAMQRAESAIRDIGVSPNIFEGKGEEMGRLGTSLVSAGNPNYRRDLYDQMKFESDPDRYEILMKEYRKAGGNVPGGRGIAPPSAYMR